MNVDIAALRAIEREKDISFETVIDAIQTALLSAYRHTDGHASRARVVIDRKSGLVQVLARELDDEGNLVREWDDTPDDFGRIAAMTAKQVILQRLREAEQDNTFGEFAGREGDLVGGVVEADAMRNERGVVAVRLTSKLEAAMPSSEQVPGESYAHASRIKVLIVSVVRGPSAAATRTWYAGCSPSRFPRSPTAPSRSWRSRARPGTARRSPSGRTPPTSARRGPASARWAPGCGT
jgi:N utilization substance protein A